MSLKNRIIGHFGNEIPPVRTESAARQGPGPAAPLAVRALSELEREWLQRIHQKLMEMIDLSLFGRMEEKQARIQISELAERIMDEQAVPLNAAPANSSPSASRTRFLGLGRMEPLLTEPSVADILVNGCGKVYVERYGKLELTPLRFQSDAHLLNIIDRIVSSVGRRIDESSPMVDARLKDGSRVNAIIPPLAIDGPSLSIRRFTVDKLRMEDLIELGACSSDDGGFADRDRQGAVECPHFRRHRLGQDDHAECADGLHSGQRAHHHH